INGELVEALTSGAAPWQERWPPDITHICLQLRQESPQLYSATIAHRSAAATATWHIHIHDAATTEVPPPPDASGYTHVWQDPFSPEKNPPLWEAAWFSRVRATAAPSCVLMTYSVAGPVRRALAAAGWSWKRLPALLPGKREWLTATPSTAAT
ncbi:MAG: MnmC family methyltransferase, partial [Proteobacteria bacterium]|nr:MnmC family methyltransferase [Pseudomonadota bacterium]